MLINNISRIFIIRKNKLLSTYFYAEVVGSSRALLAYDRFWKPKSTILWKERSLSAFETRIQLTVNKWRQEYLRYKIA